ncbi:hypothetical protein [Arachidicoccus ginsenosidivorans]|uniref:hypothetical protein n=1 Tax=Arachidicoccus ginsenosidivorans TaxID=496057 RepID=UPI0013154D76|nr:hypothetical protein [Arachidicoccus ginsenosidivorans]
MMQHFGDKKSLYLGGEVRGMAGIFSSSVFYLGDYDILNLAYRYNAGYAEGEHKAEK